MEHKYVILYSELAKRIIGRNPFDLVPIDTWQQNHHKDQSYRFRVGEITLSDNDFRGKIPQIEIERAGSFLHGPQDLLDKIKANIKQELDWCKKKSLDESDLVFSRFFQLEPHLLASPDFYLLKCEIYPRIKEIYKKDKKKSAPFLEDITSEFTLSKLIAINPGNLEPIYDYENDEIKMGDYSDKIGFNGYRMLCNYLIDSIGYRMMGLCLSLTKVGSITSQITMDSFIKTINKQGHSQLPFFVKQDETFYEPDPYVPEPF